jgi:hypothetical protein
VHHIIAIGIAIESRRLDVLSNAILKSGEVEAMTDYTFHQAQKVIVSRKFRQEVRQSPRSYVSIDCIIMS